MTKSEAYAAAFTVSGFATRSPCRGVTPSAASLSLSLGERYSAVISNCLPKGLARIALRTSSDVSCSSEEENWYRHDVRVSRTEMRKVKVRAGSWSEGPPDVL